MYTLSVQPVLIATSIERQPLLKSQFQLRIYTVTCLLSEGGKKQVPP